ncbi:hypothetical protein IJ818_01875, partial [bacterium]|nr:hypothetical protein [bacterium]
TSATDSDAACKCYNNSNYWLGGSTCCSSENTSDCCTSSNTSANDTHTSAGKYRSDTCCHSDTSSDNCCKAYHSDNYWLGGSTCCSSENTSDCCTSSYTGGTHTAAGAWRSGTCCNSDTSSDNCCKAYHNDNYWLGGSTCCSSEDSSDCCKSSNTGGTHTGAGTWVSSSNTCCHDANSSATCCTAIKGNNYEYKNNSCTQKSNSSCSGWNDASGTCCTNTYTESCCLGKYSNGYYTRYNGMPVCCESESDSEYCCTASNNPNGVGTWNSTAKTCSHTPCSTSLNPSQCAAAGYKATGAECCCSETQSDACCKAIKGSSGYKLSGGVCALPDTSEFTACTVTTTCTQQYASCSNVTQGPGIYKCVFTFNNSSACSGKIHFVIVAGSYYGSVNTTNNPNIGTSSCTSPPSILYNKDIKFYSSGSTDASTYLGSCNFGTAAQLATEYKCSFNWNQAK